MLLSRSWNATHILLHSTLVAFLSLALTPIPFVFYW
jgi:hypothetical protein